MTNDKITKN